MAAADRVRNGEAYGSVQPPPQVFKRHRPKRLGGREGGVVPQEKDHNEVAEERLQGIASSLLEPFCRRIQIAYCHYGVREL